jgi:hypothetical protein
MWGEEEGCFRAGVDAPDFLSFLIQYLHMQAWGVVKVGDTEGK